MPASVYIFGIIIVAVIAIVIWSKTDKGKKWLFNFFPSLINIAARLVRTCRAAYSRRALGARFSRSLRMLILFIIMRGIIFGWKRNRP